MNTIKFKLSEQGTDTDRVVTFKTTLSGDTIDAYVEAFESFLAAVGFSEIVIKRRLEESE